MESLQQKTQPFNQNRRKNPQFNFTLRRFREPEELKLKAQVTPSAYGIAFRDQQNNLVASRVGLLPVELIGKREQAALYALSLAKKILEREVSPDYRLTFIACAALPSDDPNSIERRLLAA